jgi:predicted ATP-dependent serine protease
VITIDELIQDYTAKRDLLNEKLDELKALNGDEQKIENANVLFERVEKKPKMPKLMTGISCIDDNMGGLSLGSFINIAGESFVGKTTLMLKILTNLAAGHKVLFFSFEMYEDLLKNSIYKLAGENYLVYQNLLIEQKSRRLGDIDKIIREQARKGLKLFVIDSIMKIEVAGKPKEYEQRTYISSVFSKLCQELGIIVILINQISEQDQRDGRMAFKSSGNIAFDSDVNFFILASKHDKTSGDISERTMWCTKDRINGRKWKAILPTFYQFQKTEQTQEYDFSGLPK